MRHSRITSILVPDRNDLVQEGERSFLEDASDELSSQLTVGKGQGSSEWLIVKPLTEIVMELIVCGRSRSSSNVPEIESPPKYRGIFAWDEELVDALLATFRVAHGLSSPLVPFVK